ncbi:fructokinase [Aeromonas cavernicola]|uniref:Fructokinase n=1 Tax=Aeromonas cavernicola TaxID=1006623 RepID=A0A2H9U2R8_9GAMM|nr:fructokinase [Aeromonas cavernicola]PJG58300.1 fructokinase [Aeromonas cavernicola]
MRIGIDLGGTKIEVIALADDGNELFRKRVATPRHDYRQTLQAICGLVQDAETATGQSGSVGIGIPGTLSPITKRVKNANSVWLNDQPLDQDLATALARPVRIANDANCFAVSEATDGAGAGANIVFAVIIGTGCGSGIAINGKAHSGSNGIAGEFGHNPLPWLEPEEWRYQQATPCYCGRHGCIETFVSGTGFANHYRFITGITRTSTDIMALVAQNDPLAIHAIERYEQQLAKALAHAVNLIDPDVIVLGGGMSNVERLYQHLPTQLRQYAFGRECDTLIYRAKHGDSSGVRGAAWLWQPGEYHLAMASKNLSR